MSSVSYFQDVFAEALAREVTDGLFSSLPKVNKIKTSNDGSHGRANNRLDNHFSSRSNSDQSNFLSRNQEIPTQINSNRRMDIVTDDISSGKKLEVVNGRDSPAEHEISGFVPKEPPPHARKFNPFISLNQSPKQDQRQKISNFRFRSNSQNVNRSRINNRGRSISNGINEINNRFQHQSFNTVRRSDQTTTESSIITGFMPSTPPTWARKFDPVPGRESFEIDFDDLNLGVTTESPNLFTVEYDGDYPNDISDDILRSGNVGKTLAETSSSNTNLQTQQINVLGALRSTGNVFNSPKYKIAGKADGVGRRARLQLPLQQQANGQVPSNRFTPPPPPPPRETLETENSIIGNGGRQLFTEETTGLRIVPDDSEEERDLQDIIEAAEDYDFDSFDEDYDEDDSRTNRLTIGRQLNEQNFVSNVQIGLI